MAENFNLIFGSQAPETASWSDTDYQTGWNTVGSTPPTAEQFDFLQNRADKKAQELHNRLTPLEQKAQEQGRQAGTAYTAGASATVDGLPADWLLVCTTAGISGTSAVVLPDQLIDGATVTDGTITWTLRKLATNGALGYRQPSTSYALGAVAYNADLPTGTYLECTTAGTTGSGELTITSPTVGGTVSDGTVTWIVRKMESAEYRSRVIYDNAAAHNGIYRGKDLTAYFNSGEMTKAISAGTFKDIYIGDYINKNITVDGTTYQVKWEVAHIDYFYKSGDTSCDAHHVVMFPSKTVRVNTPMNATNTTEGAYIGSNMWKTIIPLFNTGIEAAFGSAHVLSHRELLANAISANAASAAGAGWTGSSTSWAWYDVKANIPSEPMIYGGTVFGSSGYDVGNAERQLAIFKFKKFSEGRLWFWLRAVASASDFCLADGDGYATYSSASNSNSYGGCRPYFLLR